MLPSQPTTAQSSPPPGSAQLTYISPEHMTEHSEPLTNLPLLPPTSKMSSRLAPLKDSTCVLSKPEVLTAQTSSAFVTTQHAASPSTTAAAMSLGTLAAAASLAAAAEPKRTPIVYPLPYLSQQSAAKLKTRHREQPSVFQLEPQALLPQPPSSVYVPSKQEAEVESMPQVPPVLTPLPVNHNGQNKGINAKPVAPAPSSSMHPSHQQSPSTHPNGKPKQRRYRATPEQLKQLIARFDLNPSPSSAELQDLASVISMPSQSVVLWFKNRRARVPHKKAEKALNAKRRENGDLPIPSVDVEKKPATVENANTSSPPFLKRSGSFSAQAAAASMAEMAMDLASGAHIQDNVRQAGRNITNQESVKVGRAGSFPARSISRSPPLLYRPRSEHGLPYDTNLVKKLGSNASNRGAEFVQAQGATQRRPRTMPPTPRLFSQKEYRVGNRVEILETGKGICRAWYSASIVGRAGPHELSLGASAAVAYGLLKSESEIRTERTPEQSENCPSDDEENDDGGDSPRTVRSPAASPTPSIARVRYTVEYLHRFDPNDRTKRLQEEVPAARIRPAPPFSMESSPGEWRPEAGEAVEVLRDGAWFVAVTQTFVVRKGYMVSFESGDIEWVRRPRLRPYQIWRGGDAWVTKMKPPLPVVRKSVGLSVTHPPGGKRKHGTNHVSSTGDDGGGSVAKDCRETRGRSKRAKSISVDRSGPDGLPEGWRVDYMRGEAAGAVKGQLFYIAPDGNRLRSLKEAQRYVKMMGPA